MKKEIINKLNDLENELIENNIENALAIIKEIKTVKNERGAGRKPKISDKKKKQMIQLYKEGNTYRDIAKKFECSVASVHRAINSEESKLK